MTQRLSKEELDAAERVMTDLAVYAETTLIIRSKSEAMIPLEFNGAQQHIHKLIEEQRSLIGRVRAIILKGRQQGCSTYVQARFYHQTTHAHGRRAFILTHEDEATKNLFEITDRFHRNCPGRSRPSTGASSARELTFDKLDSGYRVGTARTKGAGRSGTVQLFHGSEVAYWPNAETHLAGVMQSIPDAAGTEIILESTSAGPTGIFAEKWAQAVRGEGGYIAIFTPWFWQEEYRLPVPEDFEPTAEEENYAEKHGLDASQLVWRRDKIIELNGIWHFRREYPATPSEAFSAENPGALWSRKVIEEHRVHHKPMFRIMAVAVDPSTTSKVTSNEAGIVWGGIGLNGHGYVMGDETRRARPIEWAKTAVAVYDEHAMEWLIYESNQGGDMVSDLIGTIDRGKKLPVSIKSVSASRSKRARAEPVASLYEQGMVHHVGSHPALEDEMCTWDAENSNESPNRIDALVWLLTKLMLKRKVHRVAPLDLGPEPEGKWDV